jgi:subtilase family serine protease
VASAGDGGAKACPTPDYVNPPHLPGTFVTSISSPADDPNVTAVGGTNLVTSTPPPNAQTLASRYVSENAYGDPQLPSDVDGLGANVSGGIWGSGSGPSAYYPKPAYQRFVETHQKNRTIPDVSMHMGGCPGGTSILGGPDDACGFAPPVFDQAPRSYFWAYYGPIGLMGLIGTSASSPEFAGLLALEVQRFHSRLGNANTLIYALAAADPYLPGHVYHRGIPGYNGVVRTFAGATGYDPIVGVGTPIAVNFLGLFGAKTAGNPQTASNP